MSLPGPRGRTDPPPGRRASVPHVANSSHPRTASQGPGRPLTLLHPVPSPPPTNAGGVAGGCSEGRSWASSSRRPLERTPPSRLRTCPRGTGHQERPESSSVTAPQGPAPRHPCREGEGAGVLPAESSPVRPGPAPGRPPRCPRWGLSVSRRAVLESAALGLGAGAWPGLGAARKRGKRTHAQLWSLLLQGRRRPPCGRPQAPPATSLSSRSRGPPTGAAAHLPQAGGGGDGAAGTWDSAWGRWPLTSPRLTLTGGNGPQGP